MKFFVPTMDPSEAEQLWAYTRQHLSGLGLATTRRRIRALAWRGADKDHFVAVGGEVPFEEEDLVMIILESSDLDIFLDTSIAILLRDADSAADHRLAALDAVPLLSIVTQIELEGGIQARPDLAARRRAALDAMLAALPVLPFDAACAAGYRRIVEAAGFSRRKIVDRMIAATALAHGLTLVTLNGADFADVPGLGLEVWPAT
jgi:tRNA(fMet)-specific endonuclease VapC